MLPRLISPLNPDRNHLSHFLHRFLRCYGKQALMPCVDGLPIHPILPPIQ